MNKVGQESRLVRLTTGISPSAMLFSGSLGCARDDMMVIVRYAGYCVTQVSC